MHLMQRMYNGFSKYLFKIGTKLTQHMGRIWWPYLSTGVDSPLCMHPRPLESSLNHDVVDKTAPASCEPEHTYFAPLAAALQTQQSHVVLSE